MIVAISLPLSIFPAFWVMDMLGFSLNLVSFLAITLSTGILVDDAIVEIENIERHMRMGKSPYQAAHRSGRRNRPCRHRDQPDHRRDLRAGELHVRASPASSSSSSASPSRCRCCSRCLAARLVTPMLAAYFLRSHAHEEKPPGRAPARLHAASSRWSVRHYFITVCLGLVIFAGSILSIAAAVAGLPAGAGHRRSLLAIELPPGSRLSDTEKVTEDIVTLLRSRPEVDQRLRRRRAHCRRDSTRSAGRR